MKRGPLSPHFLIATMGILISSADFVGKYAISTNNFTSEELDAFISQNEKSLLVELLGCDLEALFEADLIDGVPQSAEYLAIYNEFCYDESTCGIVQSFGMKDMLAGFIYFLYARDQAFPNTITGNKKTRSTNSDSPSAASDVMILDEAQNRAIQSHQAIQSYIRKNLSTYPSFNGIEKGYSFFGGSI